MLEQATGKCRKHKLKSQNNTAAVQYNNPTQNKEESHA